MGFVKIRVWPLAYIYLWASLVAQMIKHLPTMQENWVRSLGWKDPREKEMATHSSILAWKIPWMEESCRLQSMRSQIAGHNWATSLHFTGCHWALGRACWGTEHIPTGYLVFIRERMYFHVTLSMHPTRSFSHCVHKSVFYICVSIAPLQVSLSVPSFKSW